jgi:asparagine synthetase B (glutamine-hydrolysing)
VADGSNFQNWTHLYPNPFPNFNPNIPNLSQIFDEPFGDSSAIPTLLVAKLAKQHVTVSLSGDAGDELFGGYERYSKFERWNNQVSLIPSVFRQPLSAAIRIAPLKFSNFGKRHQKLLAEILASKNPTKLYSLLTSHWLDGDNVVIDKTEANYWLNKNSRLDVSLPLYRLLNSLSSSASLLIWSRRDVSFSSFLWCISGMLCLRLGAI